MGSTQTADQTVSNGQDRRLLYISLQSWDDEFHNNAEDLKKYNTARSTRCVSAVARNNKEKRLASARNLR